MASAYAQVPQETVCEKKSCSDECCQRVDFEKMFFFFFNLLFSAMLRPYIQSQQNVTSATSPDASWTRP